MRKIRAGELENEEGKGGGEERLCRTGKKGKTGWGGGGARRGSGEQSFCFHGNHGDLGSDALLWEGAGDPWSHHTQWASFQPRRQQPPAPRRLGAALGPSCTCWPRGDRGTPPPLGIWVPPKGGQLCWLVAQTEGQCSSCQGWLWTPCGQARLVLFFLDLSATLDPVDCGLLPKHSPILDAECLTSLAVLPLS